MRGWLGKFITYLYLRVSGDGGVVVAVVSNVVVVEPGTFVALARVLAANLYAMYLSIATIYGISPIRLCLLFLNLLIKAWHSLKVSWST